MKLNKGKMAENNIFKTLKITNSWSMLVKEAFKSSNQDQIAFS